MSSKYRCRNCRKSFWVDRRLAVYLFVAAIVGTLAVVAAVFALRVIGDLQSNAKREADAARYRELTERASRENPAAEYEIYRMFANGSRVPARAGEAIEWLRRAAEHGHADAQYELATALREGHEALQDYERAFEWMRRSAAGGNARAHHALGLMHRDGIGTPPDPVKSYVHFNVAAAQGFADAVVLRNSIMARLTPEQLVAAQADARRMVEERP